MDIITQSFVGWLARRRTPMARLDKKSVVHDSFARSSTRTPITWGRLARYHGGHRLLEIAIAIGMFLVGVVAAIWATERLLEGLVGLARLTTLSTFAIGAVLSGFEAENVAVGLAAALGGRGGAPIALGTVFGGATFLVGIALGLGAIFYPMKVRLPTGFLVVLALAPLLPGLALIGAPSGRLVGV